MFKFQVLSIVLLFCGSSSHLYADNNMLENTLEFVNEYYQNCKDSADCSIDKDANRMHLKKQDFDQSHYQASVCDGDGKVVVLKSKKKLGFLDVQYDQSGYSYNPGSGSCEDIDECSLGTHNCQDLCFNSVGSFSCVSCPANSSASSGSCLCNSGYSGILSYDQGSSSWLGSCKESIGTLSAREDPANPNNVIFEGNYSGLTDPANQRVQIFRFDSSDPSKDDPNDTSDQRRAYLSSRTPDANGNWSWTSSKTNAFGDASIAEFYVTYVTKVGGGQFVSYTSKQNYVSWNFGVSSEASRTIKFYSGGNCTNFNFSFQPVTGGWMSYHSDGYGTASGGSASFSLNGGIANGEADYADCTATACESPFRTIDQAEVNSMFLQHCWAAHYRKIFDLKIYDVTREITTFTPTKP